MKEIERKFLVLVDKLPNLVPNYQAITQAYMHEADPMTRIRIAHSIQYNSGSIQKAYITLKGIGLLERDEIEFDMPVEKAKEAIRLWSKCSISKLRYEHIENDTKWEIDFFSGPLEGLVIAEVELESTDQEFITPEWIGREVTNDPDYTNVKLAQNGMPY
jgi:adenylate cyclase